jgi:two-component system chemotaxis sensor kinase CheA
MDPLAAIKDIFFQECEEKLAELESGLLAMEEGASDSETINAVFRAVHSIKGGAGAFSLEALIRFAHVFETAMDEMRSGRLASTPDVLKVLLRAADILADLVRAARDGEDTDEARSAVMADELKALSGSAEAEEEADGDDWGDFDFQPVGVAGELQSSVWRISFRPRADLYAKANEVALLLRELRRLGEIEVELDCSGLPPLAELDPHAAYLGWTVLLTTRAAEAAIHEVFEFV